MATNARESKINDDIHYGALFGLIGNIIAFLLLFFGGGKETLWLSVIGFIVAGISALIPLVNMSNGITNILIIIGTSLLVHFGREKILSGAKVKDVILWVIGSGNIDAFYVSRLLAVVLVVSAAYHLIKFLRTSSK